MRLFKLGSPPELYPWYKHRGQVGGDTNHFITAIVPLARGKKREENTTAGTSVRLLSQPAVGEYSPAVCFRGVWPPPAIIA